MTGLRSCIYAGTVVHKRVSPKSHGFSYRVFALHLDVDEIAEIARRSRVLGHNRGWLASIHDADHGGGAGASIGDQIRGSLREAGLEVATARVSLVCYPRIFGYVFNPLSAYFCRDEDDRLRAIVYEVSNTFGERRSYILPVQDAGAGIVHQACDKAMYVSPFTAADGRYGFHIVPPGDRLVIGITMRDATGPILKTHFRGDRLPMTDAGLASMLVRHPLMTLKVIGAIHVEAARLWLKGVPPVKRFRSPPYAVTIVTPPSDAPSHVQ